MSEELKPLSCPYCAAEIIGDARFFEHPKNDCWMSEWEYDCDIAAWNRRSAPAEYGSAAITLRQLGYQYQQTDHGMQWVKGDGE